MHTGRHKLNSFINQKKLFQNYTISLALCKSIWYNENRLRFMKLFTARYANRNLNDKDYTKVKISLGTPKWKLGYTLDGEMKDLMPFGLFREYDEYETFKPAYFKRLDSIGVDRIQRQLNHFLGFGKDVVLLCFEDIRKESDWCHRTAFAEWYRLRTGNEISELQESPIYEPSKKFEDAQKQMTLFDLL